MNQFLIPDLEDIKRSKQEGDQDHPDIYKGAHPLVEFFMHTKLFEKLYSTGNSQILYKDHSTSVISLNIGRYIATTINPTVPPRKTISNGSSIEVSAETAASTSSS